MARTEGYSTTQESIDDGNSTTVTVEANEADTVYVYVTDGSGNAVSESYNLTVEVKKGTPHDSNNTSKWYEETNLSASSTTAVRHTGSTSGGKEIRATLENEADAGGSQTYEIVVDARCEGAV